MNEIRLQLVITGCQVELYIEMLIECQKNIQDLTLNPSKTGKQRHNHKTHS